MTDEGCPLVEGAPHMASPDDQLRIWFADPACLIDVHRGGHFDAKQAQFLTTTASAVVEKIVNERGIRAAFVHDWSRLTSYDVETRRMIIDWGLRWGRRRIDHIWVVLGPGVPTMVRMACSLGSMAMNVAGIGITITEDIDVVNKARAFPRMQL